MKEAALSEMKDDLSRCLRMAGAADAHETCARLRRKAFGGAAAKAVSRLLDKVTDRPS